jgi:oligo-1,6-glucosidase
MMNRWVERGVDGFRMDVINLISKRPELRDAAPVPGRRFVPADDQFANGPRLEEFLQEMNAAVGLASGTCSPSGRCRAPRSSWPAG